MKFNNNLNQIDVERILIKINNETEYNIFLKFLSKFKNVERYFQKEDFLFNREHFSHDYPNIALEKYDIDRTRNCDEKVNINVSELNRLNNIFKDLNEIL